jgi:hypothetical protein
MKALLTVLVSPRATFERIRDQGGHFAAPFVTVLVVAALTVLLTMPLVMHQLEQAGNEMAAVMDDAVVKSVTIASSYVTAVLAQAVSIFIAGLLLMIINLIVRGEAGYMQLVKVALFSGVPGLINGLLVGVLVRVMGPADAMGVSISLADALPETEGFLRGLAALVNPFTIWGLALMVIGTAVMARKPTKQVGVWLVSGWLLLQLLFIWIGSAFGAFSNLNA